jgi:hypothetical protein
VTNSLTGSRGEPRERDPNAAEPEAIAPQYWTITLRRPDGNRYPPRHVRDGINHPDPFRAHLIAIARIEAPAQTDNREGWVGDYELEVREPVISSSASRRKPGPNRVPPAQPRETGLGREQPSGRGA